MSAMYKCNWCNKKLTCHSYVHNISFDMPKKINKTKHTRDLKVTVSIAVPDHDLDICDKCLREAKEQVVKELKEIKI